LLRKTGNLPKAGRGILVWDRKEKNWGGSWPTTLFFAGCKRGGYLRRGTKGESGGREDKKKTRIRTNGKEPLLGGKWFSQEVRGQTSPKTESEGGMNVRKGGRQNYFPCWERSRLKDSGRKQFRT